MSNDWSVKSLSVFALNCWDATFDRRTANLGYLVRGIWGENKTSIQYGGGASNSQPYPHPRTVTDSSFVLDLAK